MVITQFIVVGDGTCSYIIAYDDDLSAQQVVLGILYNNLPTNPHLIIFTVLMVLLCCPRRFLTIDEIFNAKSPSDSLLETVQYNIVI